MERFTLSVIIKLFIGIILLLGAAACRSEQTREKLYARRKMIFFIGILITIGFVAGIIIHHRL